MNTFALDEVFTGPFAGLACDGGKTREGCGLFFVHGAEFRHVGQQGMGGDGAKTWNAGEDSILPDQFGIGFDQSCDFSVERFDLRFDLTQSCGGMAFAQGQGQSVLPAGDGGAIRDQAGARGDQFSQGHSAIAARFLCSGLRQSTEACQHEGIDAIGFWPAYLQCCSTCCAGGTSNTSASRLGKAPCLTRIDFGAGKAGLRQAPFQFAVAWAGRFERHLPYVTFTDPQAQGGVAEGSDGVAVGMATEGVIPAAVLAKRRLPPSG